MEGAARQVKAQTRKSQGTAKRQKAYGERNQKKKENRPGSPIWLGCRKEREGSNTLSILARNRTTERTGVMEGPAWESKGAKSTLSKLLKGR